MCYNFIKRVCHPSRTLDRFVQEGVFLLKGVFSMKNNGSAFGTNRNIDSTLKNLSGHRGASKFAFAIILLLYIVAAVFTVLTTRIPAPVMVFGNPIPPNIFTGVFSAISNICIVLMAVFFKKAGYFTALAILVLNTPMMVVNIIVRHNYTSIPGFFTNLLTVVAITMIYINNCRIGKYQQRLGEQAVTDMLTGLPNRFACTEFMEDLARRGVDFAVVSIDLNNFKSINDIMGHEIGDAVLNEVASRWKVLADSHMSGTLDFVARLGGDEFSLIVRDFHSDTDIMDTINSYKYELERKLTIENCDYFLTARFGYAKFPEDADNAVTLFSYADSAMHELKRQRISNCVLHFTNSLHKDELTLEIERKIRTALDNDAIMCYLQPQYDMSHKLRGFEAFARMKDTDGSFISPAEFIPVAEKTGLIDRVDITVFRQAAAFMGEILKDRDLDITLSVNISVRHLLKNNFLDEIKEIMGETGIPSDHLEFEITESIMVDSEGRALQYINDAKKLGIKVAIDDFGTGYSSLSYLHKIPADLLKIDKSFIDVMNNSESSKQYVATIISIGHILNLDVISEGVESNEQLETLQKIGCDYIQGYLWGRPMSLYDAAKLVSETT